jgi:hypothetical protein
MLAIAALLSWALILQAAHAQQSPLGKKLTVALSETLAVADGASKGFSLNESVTDKVTVSDATVKSVEKPTPRSIATKVTIDSIRKNIVHATHKVSMHIFEQVWVTDRAEGPSVVAVKESLAVRERPLLSGAILPPAPPQLTVPGGGQQTFDSERDDSVEIAFHSSSAGTYKVDIKNAAGDAVATIAGTMVAGENQVNWTGVDSQGKAAPADTYTYYITAKNGMGVRSAPSGGDGKIVVRVAGAGAAAPAFPSRQDLEIPFIELLPIALPVAAAGGAGVFLVSRRMKKKLVLYLPPDAAPVIDDIRQRYPSATVEDYMSPGEQGSSRYMGVVIADSKESGDEWIMGIIAKAKELARVDSINVSYKGKMRSV